MIKPFLLASSLLCSATAAYAQEDRSATPDEISQYCDKASTDGNPGTYLLSPFESNNFEIIYCDEYGSIVAKNNCASLETLSEIFRTRFATRSVELGRMTAIERQQQVDAIISSLQPALDSCRAPVIG